MPILRVSISAIFPLYESSRHLQSRNLALLHRQHLGHIMPNLTIHNAMLTLIISEKSSDCQREIPKHSCLVLNLSLPVQSPPSPQSDIRRAAIF